MYKNEFLWDIGNSSGRSLLHDFTFAYQSLGEAIFTGNFAVFTPEILTPSTSGKKYTRRPGNHFLGGNVMRYLPARRSFPDRKSLREDRDRNRA